MKKNGSQSKRNGTKKAARELEVRQDHSFDMGYLMQMAKEVTWWKGPFEGYNK